ncbi:DNA phosphorothioation system restriction enzyme [Nodularia spumigena CS-586/05]|uniref:DNA phosphorothioation system restriction enzyme n=2 Tax=Nodularia spumigena TaxID=70799 RepID=UPI00232E71AA|nr:DNA phosphorothioation system restriction enzyme [Nodularia spumigena]MDB9323176.1 DNA phosphorothioation system restriction enzyme [Nodularia spumigena CS-591/07A]MDB9344206.1 DNA phosphorothioation system restriction enzyme [Nodularia spumigena CS-588/06]MDB9359517.1 DNA phosphorothioation system restriction enzyme [Nodularia spumigena CS-588/02]MDB9364228.1 DNA phosphorothioation system restriction enzyme [Nodularia spumigena CS-588/02A10]MDB9370508.1 DNA phosphorothioation system restri
MTNYLVQKQSTFRLKFPFVREGKGSYQTRQPLPGCPILPVSLQLRPYQRQAITSWFANNGRGTLKMATGSGKTITALAIACELYQQINLQVLLVICPYRHLVTQWARECEKFNLQPILAFENLRTWQSQLSTQLYNLRSGSQNFLTVITTNSTLISDGFQSQLKYFPPKTLIIGDEAHNLGAPKLEENLPRRVGLRLALSATPERYFDDYGTQSLFDYFGSVLQPEFNLKDAIAQGALVHYLYYPILVELTETESIAYLRLTKKIGRSLLYRERENCEARNFEENEDLKPLLMQRARLIGTAENKLTALQELMTTRRESTHTLFYCSDGSQETGQRSSLRQLKAVAKILGVDLGYRVSTYTAHTSLKERETLRRQFESGELQGLVAIRCLDEGVDIPAIQTAVILSSSGNPRQFIQRRGRVLRPHIGKERATIFDMIVLPPDLDRETIEIERNLLKKELRRFVEFADLADNAGEARMKLLNLQKRYGLLDI